MVSSSTFACQSPATFSLLHLLKSAHPCPVLNLGSFHQPTLFSPFLVNTVIKWHFLSSLSRLLREKRCYVLPWWNALIHASMQNNQAGPARGCEAAQSDAEGLGWPAGVSLLTALHWFLCRAGLDIVFSHPSSSLSVKSKTDIPHAVYSCIYFFQRL